MIFLISIGSLLVTFLLSIYIYYYVAIFRRIGVVTVEEINEDETQESGKLSQKETTVLNVVGRIVFFILGALLWMYTSVTVGRIVSQFSSNTLLNILVCIIGYIVFLRIPFGISHKMIKKTFEIDILPEKLIFAFLMMITFILSICGYHYIPSFFTWHLGYWA